jgi:hypothetical protein
MGKEGFNLSDLKKLAVKKGWSVDTRRNPDGSLMISDLDIYILELWAQGVFPEEIGFKDSRVFSQRFDSLREKGVDIPPRDPKNGIPTRVQRRILLAIESGDETIPAIAERLNMTQENVRAHFYSMRNRGIPTPPLKRANDKF